MNHPKQPNVKNFVEQVAFVARVENILKLPPDLEHTFRLARESFTRDLDQHMPANTLLCANYGSQVGSNIVAAANKHHNKLSMLKIVHAYMEALDTTFADCKSWRIANAEGKIGLTEELKRAERAKWEDWGARMTNVCWEICACLWAEMEACAEAGNGHAAFGTRDKLDFETKKPMIYTSPYPPIQQTVDHETEEKVKKLQLFQQEQHRRPKRQYTDNDDDGDYNDEATPSIPISIPDSARNCIDSTSVDKVGNPIQQSGRGGRSRHFTPAQNKKILLWMKQNKAWSIQNHKAEYEQLLQDALFDDVRGESQVEKSRFRKRIRDKMDKLRGQLLKEGAAEKVMHGTEARGNAQLTKSAKTNELVFDNWTDAWLNDDWDGNIKKPDI